MRVRSAALATALLVPPALAAAACGGGPSTAGASATPALSKAQAAEVLKQYADANNRANKAMDDKLLATAETGTQLEMDAAAYKLRRTTKKRFKPFSYTQPTFYIPRVIGYPRWFAVDATSEENAKTKPEKPGKPAKPGDVVRHALLFVQARADAPWLLAADPYPTGTPLSSIALDKEGYATAVKPAERKLAVPPAKLGETHAALLTGGPQVKAAKPVAPGPQTSQAYDGLREAADKFKGIGVTLSSRFSPHPAPVYALRTTDGGALVWYALKQNESYTTQKPGKLSITGDLIGLAPARSARTRLDTTVYIQYLAKVPRQGQAAVTGMYRKAIQAAAS